MSDSLLVRRLAVWMLGVFALLALILAIVGIYGLTSYSVSRSTHDIGIRLALGESHAGILRMMLRRSVMAALAGVAIGIPGAFAISRFMSALLFGITATDALTYAAAPVLILFAAAAAAYVPARRALRVDPIIALRYE